MAQWHRRGRSPIRFLSVKDGPKSFNRSRARGTSARFAGQWAEAMDEAWREVDPRTKDDIEEVIRRLVTLHGVPLADLGAVRRRLYHRYEPFMHTERVGLARENLRGWTAAAGTPNDGGPAFKSQWERRLAATLTRLGVRWTYEPDYFTYNDGTNTWRRYWPDFRLDDFANVYVEVKGPTGANAGDDWKMRRVMANYPQLTLLLWDADHIEYVEDLQDAAALVGLLRTTRFAA